MCCGWWWRWRWWGGGGGGEVGSLMTDSVVTLGNLSGGTTVQHEMV